MPKHNIKCEKANKLLAVIDEHKLYLWCKSCRAEHTFSTEELARLLKGKVLTIGGGNV